MIQFICDNQTDTTRTTQYHRAGYELIGSLGEPMGHYCRMHLEELIPLWFETDDSPSFKITKL